MDAWVNEWMNEWLNEWANEWLNASMNKLVTERTSELICDRMNEYWRNELINERIKDQNEWKNKWMNKRLSFWTLTTRGQGQHSIAINPRALQKPTKWMDASNFSPYKMVGFGAPISFLQNPAHLILNMNLACMLGSNGKNHFVRTCCSEISPHFSHSAVICL